MLGFLFVDEERSRARSTRLDDAGRDVVRAARDALEPLESWSTAASRRPCATRSSRAWASSRAIAFGPVRVAVTGRRVSPPLFESLELLGRERSLARLAAALA